MASSPIVWTPDKRMKLQSAAADLSPEAFQAVVSKVFGPATLAMRRRWSPRDVDFEGLEAAHRERGRAEDFAHDGLEGLGREVRDGALEVHALIGCPDEG